MNVAKLLDSLASWPTLLLAIAFYGFAPGFLLWLIVLTYEREDPRRTELVAELHAVPRLKRPFWVAEQMETALFDGLAPRIKWALTGRIILRWNLRSGVKQNRKYRESFWIPSKEEKTAIVPGVEVKLMFEQSDGWGDRMWVQVEQANHFRLVGRLANHPLDFPRLDYGTRIKFRRKHIIDINWEPSDTCESTPVPTCSACSCTSPAKAIRVEPGT